MNALPGFPEVPPAPPKERNRASARRIKSDRSYIKHAEIRRAVRSQVFAYREKHPRARIVLIDGNAGDGVGVPIPGDLFCDGGLSCPTAQTLTEIADLIGAMVILCETVFAKRERLKALYPRALVLSNNKLAARRIPEHCDHVVWLSDARGQRAAEVGIEPMGAVAARRDFTSDFIIVQNVAGHRRGRGTSSPVHEKTRSYLEQTLKSFWFDLLNKTEIAATDLIPQSPGFVFRLLIAANHISDYAARKAKFRYRRP
jgi:hypothetical protein